MIIWNSELYHSWGTSLKMKRLERLYNAWYYKTHKEKWKDNKNTNESSGHKFNNYGLGTRKKVKTSSTSSTKSTGSTPSFSRSGTNSGTSSTKNTKTTGNKSGSGKGRKSSSGKGRKSGSGKGKKKSAKKSRATKPVKKTPVDSYSYNYIYENGKLVKVAKKKAIVTNPKPKKSKSKKSKRKKFKKTLTKRKSTITKKKVERGKVKFNNRSK